MDHAGSYRDVCTQDTGELACNDDGCGVSYGPDISYSFGWGVYFFVLGGFRRKKAS